MKLYKMQKKNHLKRMYDNSQFMKKMWKSAKKSEFKEFALAIQWNL